MRPLILAALASLLCVGAAAQDKIYKVRLPDGRILFTDRPPQGAQILSERELPPPPPAAPASPAAGEASPTSLQERSADAQSRLRERAAEGARAPRTRNGSPNSKGQSPPPSRSSPRRATN